MVTFLTGALIGEGRLLERGVFSEFSKIGIQIFICVLKFNITFLYLKNTEFSI